jgi:hypothetical protein
MMGGLAVASIELRSVFILTRFLPQISLRNLRKLDCYANRHPLRLKTLLGSKPGAYQRHVGRAGDQQCDGERQLDTLAGGLEDRSHGRKHPAILAGESRGFFFAGFTPR